MLLAISSTSSPGSLTMIAGLTFVQILILIVVVAACIALVYVALRQFGISLPGWFLQVLCIVAVAVVVILAIKVVAGIS